MERLTSAESEARDNLHAKVSKVAGAATDDMLKCMWSAFGTEATRKRSIVELEQEIAFVFLCFCVCAWSSFLLLLV